MENLNIGSSAPAFSLHNDENQLITLNTFQGQWLVLYFYPKDNTSGCTLEAIDFSKELKWFHKQGAEVVGVSPDSVKSHCNFREKHDLSVVLLSDPEKTVLEAYGVWALKKMYGREYFGVVRGTCLIDPNGKIAHVWPKVKVKGHVDAVKEKLTELKG